MQATRGNSKTSKNFKKFKYFKNRYEMMGW